MEQSWLCYITLQEVVKANTQQFEFHWDGKVRDGVEADAWRVGEDKKQSKLVFLKSELFSVLRVAPYILVH